MTPTERLKFSAIADRPRLELPGGARLAVWIIVNIEEWDSPAVAPPLAGADRRACNVVRP